MEPRKQCGRQIDHLAAARNYAGLAPEPAAPMPLPEIVPLYPVRFRLGLKSAARARSARHTPPRVTLINLTLISVSFRHFLATL
jgi:hypothetical protein